MFVRGLVSVMALAALQVAAANKKLCGDQSNPDASPKPTPAPTGGPSVAPKPTGSSSPSAAPTKPTPTKPTPDGGDWAFSPVRSIKARVQGNLPVWDAEQKAYVASFGANFDERYRAVLDTVNMASVEGAFKYVQAECINYYDLKDAKCKRKNDIQYVVFYETIMAQPRPAMAKYQEGAGGSAIEHCPYLPMDGGQCTPKNGTFPVPCNEYTGANGAEKLGFCVGGNLQDNEYLAPYPDTYWFSFPNSCPQKVWKEKTAECRAANAGGLCPKGTKPDGVKCTFSFDILGWVKLDDVVGITSMVNPATNAKYSNYTEFCQAGGIEYKVKTDGGKLEVEETLPFWKDPANPAANQKRAQILVDVYNKKIQENPKTSDGGVMKPLPTAAELAEANPPCYKNNVQCAKAPNGCRRHLYTQVCEVCSKKSDDCKVAPSTFKFPNLASSKP